MKAEAHIAGSRLIKDIHSGQTITGRHGQLGIKRRFPGEVDEIPAD